MKQTQTSTAAFFIRVSAFLFKEMLEIGRQPMLLVTLVLGPFLILLFFGIGFRNEPQALRTLFVLDEDSPLQDRVERYGTTLGRQLIFAGIEHDLEAAKTKLANGQVDLVVQVPSDPMRDIRNNQQAVFDLLHRELNPIQAGYVGTFGQVYVAEVNRRVLQYFTSAGQIDVRQFDEKLAVVRSVIESLKEGLDECVSTLSELGDENVASCNADAINRQVKQLDKDIDELQMELGDTADLSESAQRWLRGNAENNARPNDEIKSTLNRIVRKTNNLSDYEDIQQKTETYLDQAQTLTQIDTDLQLLQARLLEFAGINPQVLVSPFRSQVTNVAKASVNVTDYYAPAVIVMLLQHLTVTFAALSLVRERLLGSVEVFTVSPISAFETLLGKYISYLIFGSVLALVLFALLIFGMQVPLLGSWGSVVVITLALVFTSLGIGFVISLISTTDTQAVQYAMIVLLTSVFFSGFILELHTLWEPVRIISWLLPVTYGILSLRDVMLRGNPLDWTLMGQLLAIGGLLFGLAWWLLRRSMQQV
ncbi:MAG: hypothetical protein D6768_08085 [Chloroflexi bacterium]|nr:MAG: hypothetical protein D6768_08085 [Chloroflexota bacterium]